ASYSTCTRSQYPMTVFNKQIHTRLSPTLFPYTTLFRSRKRRADFRDRHRGRRLPDRGRREQGRRARGDVWPPTLFGRERGVLARSEEHTSELQSLRHLVCRLLLEKKKRITPLIRITDLI